MTQEEGHVSKEEEAKTDNTYFEIVKKKRPQLTGDYINPVFASAGGNQ